MSDRRTVAALPPALAGNGAQLLTRDEWLAECDRVEKCRSCAGLPPSGAMLTLTMRAGRKLHSREWDNVPVMPGVRGRVVGELEPGIYMIEVPAARVRLSPAMRDQ